MHASLVSRPSLTVGAVERNVSLFGEADPGESEARVSVQVSMSLRFIDVVGLLAFHPGLVLTASDLQWSEALAEAMQFALINSDMLQIEEYAQMAADALSHPRRNSHAYTKLVAEAVTRTFGISAPTTTRRRAAATPDRRALVPADVLPADGHAA